MNVEQLKQVTESEALAEEMKKNAKVLVKKRKEEIKQKSIQILQTAEKAGQASYKVAIAEAEKDAAVAYQTELEKSRASCEQIGKETVGRMEDAVKRVKERIVNSSVNC